MRNTFLSTLAVLATLAIAVPTAHAIPLLYEIGSASTVEANTGSGLQLHWELDANLSSQGATLNDGDSFTFKFFDIWTDETSVDNDDKDPKSITATLNFDVPSFDAEVIGYTVGVSFLGIIQLGAIIWEDPAPNFTVGGRTFSVDLSNEIFNLGIFGLNEGEACGATISATVKQLSSTGSIPTPFPPQTQVPDSGATAMLLGFALLGITLYQRHLLRLVPARNRTSLPARSSRRTH